MAQIEAKRKLAMKALQQAKRLTGDDDDGDADSASIVEAMQEKLKIFASNFQASGCLCVHVVFAAFISS